MAIDMSQFRQVFFDEAAEYLATAEALLLYLDPRAPDPEQLEDVHRAVHSIKGSSATFGFKAMADLAQCMQGVLEGVRGAARPLSDDGHAALVDACRILRGLLAAQRDGREEDAAGAAAAGVRLSRIAEGRETVVPVRVEAAEPGAAQAGAAQPAETARSGGPEPGLAAAAGDLRELAQRAGAAAQEIARLARGSGAEEAELAREAEESIGDMLASFGRLEGVVVGMAAAAGGADAREIAAAVRRLGEAIRQNEARARQSAQSAGLLRERFDALARAVARFALSGARAPGGKAGGHARGPLPKVRRASAGAKAGEEWPEF